MARIRTIKPEFFRHEILQDLTVSRPELYPMLVFAGIWGHCDKNGVFEWKPRQLALDILPFIWMQSRETLDDSLMFLWETKLIKKMELEGKFYGFVPSFTDHQRITGKESMEESRFPQPGEMIEILSGKQQGNISETTGTTGREGKGREKEGNLKDIIPSKFFGEFSNVKLSEDEFSKMVELFGEAVTIQKIEKLSAYVASTGKKYKSHYATILNWDRKDSTQNPALPLKTPVKTFAEIKQTRDRDIMEQWANDRGAV